MGKSKIVEWEKIVLPIPYDLKSVNSYIIEESSGLTIIDSGDLNDESKMIWKRIIGDRKVWRVLITHLHIDHFGLAKWFQTEYGAEIWMSERSNTELEKRKQMFENGIMNDSNLTFMKDYGMVENSKEAKIYNVVEPFLFSPDHLFAENQLIKGDSYVLKPIWTPGHCYDHYCFYEVNTGFLFLGDHLLEIINPIVLPSTEFQNPLTHYLATFDNLLKLEVTQAFTGHGENIKNLNERVNQLKKHYNNKCKQIVSVISEKGVTPKEITDIVYAHKPPELRGAAFIQIITYLHYLVAEGFIKRHFTEKGYLFLQNAKELDSYI